MSWYNDDKISVPVGSTVGNGDVISKKVMINDPRYLVVVVEGGLTAFKIQGRTGNGAWRDIKTVSTKRLVFIGPQETSPDLLDDQIQVVATGSGDVTNVFIVKI